MDTISTPVPQPAPAPMRRALLALGLLGTLLMSYLSYLHFKPTGSALCNFGAGFSCDLVNKSTFAEVAGVPVSFLGLGYFVTVALLASGLVAWRRHDHLRFLLLATVASLAFSAYLTHVELNILDSICVFCEASKLTMLGILAVTVSSMRKAGERVPWMQVAGAVAVGVAFTALAAVLRNG